jgi:hypothetical protein
MFEVSTYVHENLTGEKLEMFATCSFKNESELHASMFLWEEMFLCPRFRRSPEGTQPIALL